MFSEISITVSYITWHINSGISDRRRLGSPTPLPVIVSLHHYYLPSSMPTENRRLNEMQHSCRIEYINQFRIGKFKASRGGIEKEASENILASNEFMEKMISRSPGISAELSDS